MLAQRSWSKNPVLGLSVWKSIDAIVASELADMTLLPLSKISAGGGSRPPKLCAEITFSLAEDEAEVPLLIGVDAQSLAAIENSMLGESDSNEEMLRDLVLEMSNVVGGAFKRKAIDEGFVFATGLPRQVHTSELPGMLDDCEETRHFCVTSDDGEVVVEVRTGARRRENRIVCVADLVEGMVLAANVLNLAGVLLFPAGTRFTETTVARARSLLNPAFVVEVAGAA